MSGIQCKVMNILFPVFVIVSLCLSLATDQRLDLNKLSPNDSDTVRGQIVGECR